MSAKRLGLGKGLDALISMDDLSTEGSSSMSEIALDLIKPNPEQPRSVFEEEALEELAASIRSLGLIQPITLRAIEDGRYQIISGERRYRASLKAGLDSIPAYIKTADDDEVMEMALIENIQREDLNPIEIALAYQKLLDSYNMTQEQLSNRIGKKRATISNYIRLLRLPAEVQVGITQKKVDMGHARALLALPEPKEQLKMYELIVQKGLSVRQVEQIIRSKKEEQKAAKKSHKETTQIEDFTILTKQLSHFFNVNVDLKCNKKGKGRITIPFDSEEELEQIMARFDRLQR